jgi:hypothetical protein
MIYVNALEIIFLDFPFSGSWQITLPLAQATNRRRKDTEVPPGQPTIARRFNSGCQSSNRIKSRRDRRKHISTNVLPVAPAGLVPFWPATRG